MGRLNTERSRKRIVRMKLRPLVCILIGKAMFIEIGNLNKYMKKQSSTAIPTVPFIYHINFVS